MPKVDITKTSGNSKMPELKKVRPKGQPKSKMPSLNASSVHHSGDVKVTEIVSSETIETENGTETRTESLIIEEPVNQPEESEEKELELEEKEDEPELVENLDNFEEKKDDFDMEIKEEKMPKKSKKNKKEIGKGLSIFSKAIFFIYLIAGILFFINVLKYLPESLTLVFVISFALLSILFAVFTFLKKFKKVAKILSIFYEIILTAIFIFATIDIDKFTDFILAISAKDYQIEEYYVIVKKDSEFEKSEDLSGHSIATYTDNISDNYKKALEEFAKKSSAEQKSSTDFSDASFAFLNSEADALFLKGSLKDTVEEIVNDFNKNNPNDKVPAFNENNIKIIDTIEIKIEVKQNDNENIDLTTEPFNIFISGIDTYGDISLVSRSDVNMIATVNPKEHKILLTSIPRDYYVQLHGTTGLKDKLTHAGIYGVDMSRQTLEDLFETDIKFFARVNFSSVIKIVDAIGGITINSDTALNLAPDSGIGKYCSYIQGENAVDGDCALRFARERHSYYDGDNHRIKNQQEVLDAIIKKVSSSKTLISSYSELLSALNGNFETNIPTNQIYKLVQNQLRDMPSWNVERITVAGTGAHDLTYSIPSQSLYVMIPDQTTVDAAKKKINETLGLIKPEPETTEEPTEETEEVTE